MDPITWIYLIVMLVVLIAAIALAPHPKSQPPNDADLQVPTAEDGREVMDIAGECWIDDANVIWYGNLRTRPVKADSGK